MVNAQLLLLVKVTSADHLIVKLLTLIMKGDWDIEDN